jgi:hypothetical protein
VRRLVVLALLAAGCSGSSSPRVPADVVVRIPLQSGDVAQTTASVRSGHELMRPLSGRCGIVAVTGTHAEYVPKRPLCHLRVRIVSDDATAHSVLLDDQRLVLSDGTRLPLSIDAMHIKRQPAEVELGAHNAAEVELWWEPPTGAKVRGVLLVGDHDIDVQGTAVAPASNPNGVEVRLRGF